jgi:hypothetical protein
MIDFNHSVSIHLNGHSLGLLGYIQRITMSEPIASQFISRRRLLWLVALAAAVTTPPSVFQTSDARAQQSDQAPAAEPTTPKKKTKSRTDTKTKSKTKKTTPGDTTAPAANPPATPKQQ